MKPIIAPSILSADFGYLAKDHEANGKSGMRKLKIHKTISKRNLNNHMFRIYIFLTICLLVLFLLGLLCYKLFF